MTINQQVNDVTESPPFNKSHPSCVSGHPLHLTWSLIELFYLGKLCVCFIICMELKKTLQVMYSSQRIVKI